MVRTEWPPRPRLIITVGVAIGLAVWLELIPNVIYERADPVSLLFVVNVAAVGLALLLTQGPWRRGAASFTLTLAFWMALYSTFSFVHWRSTIKRIESLKAQRIAYLTFFEQRLGTVLKTISPPFRALRRADLELSIARGNRIHDRSIKESSEQATEWRNVFFLSLSCSLLCAVGAKRRLKQRSQPCQSFLT